MPAMPSDPSAGDHVLARRLHAAGSTALRTIGFPGGQGLELVQVPDLRAVAAHAAARHDLLLCAGPLIGHAGVQDVSAAFGRLRHPRPVICANCSSLRAVPEGFAQVKGTASAI
jgi:hypothetical protein